MGECEMSITKGTPASSQIIVQESEQMVQRTAGDNYDWMLPHKSKVTHWMPLPAAPQEKQK